MLPVYSVNTSAAALLNVLCPKYIQQLWELQNWIADTAAILWQESSLYRCIHSPDHPVRRARL
jgi:hypothetical protein